MSDTNAVLAQLFDKQSITLPVLGKEVGIRKITLRTMKPVTDLLSRVLEDLKLDAGNLPSVDLGSPAMILKLISKHYDEVMGIVVAHSTLEMDELLDMDTDESVLVIQAVIALNKDFFTKKVLPNLQLLGGAAS